MLRLTSAALVSSKSTLYTDAFLLYSENIFTGVWSKVYLRQQEVSKMFIGKYNLWANVKRSLIRLFIYVYRGIQVNWRNVNKKKSLNSVQHAILHLRLNKVLLRYLFAFWTNWPGNIVHSDSRQINAILTFTAEFVQCIHDRITNQPRQNTAQTKHIIQFRKTALICAAVKTNWV